MFVLSGCRYLFMSLCSDVCVSSLLLVVLECVRPVVRSFLSRFLGYVFSSFFMYAFSSFFRYFISPFVIACVMSLFVSWVAYVFLCVFSSFVRSVRISLLRYWFR